MDFHAYRFGGFLLDPAKRILLHDGVVVMLPPKAFDVIVYLIEQRERAVGRDELIAAVWGKVDITDNALGQVVLQARRALDDSGEGGQRIIRTVPRFGYRWAVEVAQAVESAVETDAWTANGSSPSESSLASQTAADDQAVPPRAEPVPSTRWRLTSWLLLGVVALVAVVWLGTRPASFMPQAGSTAAARSSLVVLPFVVDAPPASSWMRLGVMDLVAQRLRAADQSVVPSDNVVGLARRFQSAEGRIDAPALVRATGAATWVEGRARRSGGNWQVLLQMPEHALRAEGEANDVILAARIAADRLALALGLRPAVDEGVANDLAGLLQQVRAAILSEQLDHARSLLLAADEEAQALPEIRFHRAEIDFRLGHLDAAERALEELLGQVAPGERSPLRPRILNTLANIAYQRNDPEAVVAYSNRALELLAGENDAGETGRALIGRASARQAQHRYDEALADFAQARIVLETSGDRLALARVEAYQGLLEINRERFAEALPVLHDAVRRLQAFDAVVEELHARVGIAMAELAMLEPAAALAQCARLDDLAQRVSDPRRKHYAALVCIDARVANGLLGDAGLRLRALREQAQPREQTLLRQSRVQLHRVGATLAQALEQPETVITEVEAALALPADYDAPDEHARLLWQLARAQRALGRSDAFAATAAESQRWREQHMQQPSVRVHGELLAAEQAIASHDHLAADRALSAALSSADASRVPVLLLDAVQVQADHLLAVGELERASAVIGRVGPLAGRCYEAALLQLRLHHALRQPGPWQVALHQAGTLAGERVIPPVLRRLPPPLQLDDDIPNAAQTPR